MNNSQYNFNFEEEININFIKNLIIRNKFLIFIFLIFGILGGFLYSNSLQKMWKGSFQIVVRDETNIQNKLDNFSPKLFRYGINKGLMTEKAILKSPSVLMPVFEFVKNENGISDNITFDQWINSSLEVGFKDDTSVLAITYKNSNKKLINDVLNMISKRYKEYSTSDNEKRIINSITYLTNQEKIYLRKTRESMKVLNEFSIKNGLGSIESLQNLSRNEPNLNNINNQNEYSFGKRFSGKFSTLEQYEILYLDLSSKLKPSTKTLTNLKVKIDNLKEALKRPNEILVKYKELVKIANRDESLLNSIQKNLSLLNLEKAKNIEPWNLISNPQLDENYFFPNFKKIILLFSVAGFISSVLLSFLLEKKSGIIYEFNSLRKLVDAKFLNNIFLDDIELSKKIIDKTFGEDKNKNNGLVFICDKNSENIFINNDLFKKKKSYKFFNLDNINSLVDMDYFVVSIRPGHVSNHQLQKLNIFLNLYNTKIKGWFSIDNLN